MEWKCGALCLTLFLLASISNVVSSVDETDSEQYQADEARRAQQRGGYIPTRPHPCDQSSCYPATGNLLIGREPKLTATSTCGTYGEERYCIVSHLEDRKKCFRCDSRDRFVNNPGLSHRIDNILHRNYPGTQQRSWWQSENGKENVSIRLDLEAEFHFTHLIITFKTFRPAAMLIERSFDFGRTWKVYRYMAYDCDYSFPGVPKGPAKSITDVICESRYSEVQPSTEGEAIFRVLPRNIHIQDPYAPEVQNLLKMTNLRINFTKLHTLGDDLLDRRQEIQEKYYYSIYEMVVRGSCSCYGHASRCLPGNAQGGVHFTNAEARPDMVHGRCECTHNTKGLNCEECEDFYRDLPWKPAIGKLTNACKRCNCNNHAFSCHFDTKVFEDSGSVSGGVCDNCQHNTMGHKCELCKPKYYLSPEWQITDEHACQSCDCDPRGSLDEGCDSTADPENKKEAGSCHCKRFVTGRRCDYCVNGYWNLEDSNPEGCKPCSCNLFGTVGNEGCNVYTGECTCKRYVTGRDCNQCLPEYWGLSEDKEGCKPCDCDVGGAYDNNCDVITGQCRCRPNLASRNCSIPQQGYYAANLDYLMYEAELAQTSPNTQVVIREPYRDGRKSTWTGVGFVRAFDDSQLEFTVENVISSMDYDLVIRYEPQNQGWQQANVLVTADFPDPSGPCANSIPFNTPIPVLLRSEAGEATVYPPLCLERGKKYKISLEMQSHDRPSQSPSATVLIDSISIIPRMDGIPFFHGNQVNNYRKQLYERYRCGETFMTISQYPVPEECKKLDHSVSYNVFDGAHECNCNAQGSTSVFCDTLGGQCPCKLNIVGRTCERCASGTYGFGEFSQEGCRPCECNPIGSLDNFCDSKTGQCRCRPNTYGLQCDQCQPGFWSFPNCQRCNCNGLADICDQTTGTCIECRDFTTGSSCDRCVEGYYGDPRIGVSIACRPCPCPGTEITHSFATRCALDRFTNDVICECQEGYSGPRCDVCTENYFGNPETPGGRCRPCSCNNNIDISRPGNCDMKTGACLQCLFNTEGFGCEGCKAGYYGDAIHQMCRSCVCNILGTNALAGPCNPITGQCSCLPNVTGLACEQCAENHWKIASGEGCEPCACDPVGSRSNQCNLYDGQCECRPGFGGRQCDQCETDFWGDPQIECFPCECTSWGSATMQCDRNNGSCVCVEGIGGSKCDECARGFIGRAPRCSPCGECFNNWDRVIGELNAQTSRVVEAASQVKHQGATGAYSREFETMQSRIDEVKGLLRTSSVSSSDIDKLQKMIDDSKMTFDNTSALLDTAGDGLANVSQRILLANVSLGELERKVDSLQASASSLKESAINLQEGNVEGALNLTREAKRRSDAAVRRAAGVQAYLMDSERQRRRIESYLNQLVPENKQKRDQVLESLERLENTLDDVEDVFPELNQLVCDKSGNPCDSHCGGAGCGFCGGISCEGAVTTSEAALKYAQDALIDLKVKDADAENLLRSVTQTKTEVDEAKNEAEMAFQAAEIAKNKSEAAKTVLEGLEKEINEFLTTSVSTPNDIRTLAEEVLSKNITHSPEQIDQLTTGIQESLTNLNDIDDIIRATYYDINSADVLKQRAENTAKVAEKVLMEATQVRSELDKTKEAQINAETAIAKAKEDITEADIDLKKIGTETAEAETGVRQSQEDAQAFKRRLEELQRKLLQNERKRAQAKKESMSAFQNATAMQEDANRLNNEYEAVSKALERKRKGFEQAKEKDELQSRANRLASNVNEKLTELRDIELEYSQHERRITDVLNQIDDLSTRMEENLQVIRYKEEYHRTCTP